MLVYIQYVCHHGDSVWVECALHRAWMAAKLTQTKERKGVPRLWVRAGRLTLSSRKSKDVDPRMNENCRFVYVCEGQGGWDVKASLRMWNVIATLFSLCYVARVGRCFALFLTGPVSRKCFLYCVLRLLLTWRFQIIKTHVVYHDHAPTPTTRWPHSLRAEKSFTCFPPEKSIGKGRQYKNIAYPA